MRYLLFILLASCATLNGQTPTPANGRVEYGGYVIPPSRAEHAHWNYFTAPVNGVFSVRNGTRSVVHQELECIDGFHHSFDVKPLTKQDVLVTATMGRYYDYGTLCLVQ